MLTRRSGLITITLLLQVVAGYPAGAAEVVIDDCSQATNTKFILLTQVAVNMTVPTQTATDSGLPGTIGGVRQLTVTGTSFGPAVSEQVVSGIDQGPSRLCYQATQNSDGFVELVYDAGGSGLSGDLHHAMGIEVDPFSADMAALPYSVKVTLVDSGNNSGSSTHSGNTVCSLDCAAMLFPFTDFPGVNPRHIRSISVQVDPSGGAGVAADFALGPINTYGTPTIETICDDNDDNDNNGFTDCADPACARAINCINDAPLLSPGMIGMLVAMLGTVGLAGLIRSARSK